MDKIALVQNLISAVTYRCSDQFVSAEETIAAADQVREATAALYEALGLPQEEIDAILADAGQL